jgi:hypothetical protein
MKSPIPAAQASRTGFGMILADFYLDPRAETTKKGTAFNQDYCHCRLE